jgi:nicotinate phosphoribosyltransferase
MTHSPRQLTQALERREIVQRERTDPSVFQLPVEKMRSGYYSDQYFNLTKELVEAEGRFPVVKMQAFQRERSLCGGIDEAIAILKLCSGYDLHFTEREWAKDNYNFPYPEDGKLWIDGWDQLEVKALHEGDEIEPWEPVLQIVGPYHLFAHLETVLLGVMARRSLVMRNVREAVEAASGKPLFFFPARHDHWVVQTGDGMAAHTAGVAGVSTDAGASWWGGRGMGTIPHALIAAYGGDTVAAAEAFADRYHDQMNITVLVDFRNDSVGTALAVAKRLGDKLWGVRLDTGGNLVDECLLSRPDWGSFKPTGVNPQLVDEVRMRLDWAGHEHVKIIVSGGFKAEKIREFEALGVPVDGYGVGSSLIRGSNDYTADIVETDGQPSAKVGRWARDDSRLTLVV